MSVRPHGRAVVDPDNPTAWGFCDRCQFLYNLVNLPYQYDWAGNTLVNKHLRVCEICLDEPADQLRTPYVGVDPEPVIDPRPKSQPID